MPEVVSVAVEVVTGLAELPPTGPAVLEEAGEEATGGTTVVSVVEVEV